jgi:hypothetical protein
MLHKNLNIFYTILVCIISLLFNTCTFSDNEFPVDPPFNPDSLCLCFPVGIGYEWTYRDSLSNSFYGIVTTKIVSNERDSLGRILWNVENNSNATKLFLGNQFFLRNDSLFIIGPAPFWQGKTTYLRLIPPRESEFTFYLRIDDVGRNYKVKWNKDKIIRTPSGHFKNWISLVSSTIESYDSVIVVPRVGILFRFTEFKNISGQVTNVYKSELINYKIN